MQMRTLLCALLLVTLPFARGSDNEEALNAPVRVACIGDSLTFGLGTSNPPVFSYPAQLQRMLGVAYDVRNFGVSSRTLLNSGDHPYQKEPAFQSARAFEPNVVVIMLGTNDTKPENWKFKDRFTTDYQDLIAQFADLDSKPRIFLCLPVPITGSGNYGITEAVLDEEMPLIAGLAKRKNLGLIDLHAALAGHDNYFPDRVHPDDAGANLMARAVYQAIIGKPFTVEMSSELTSAWEGYSRFDFKVDGRACLLVTPRQAAPGNPWIWRTEFFGAFAQADVALLAKGYFVAYMDVQNMYGAPVAMDHMDKFYDYLVRTYRLAPKTVLEGFSRGGLFAFHWAVNHPERVSSLYVDAPVCDFKSWPAGKGRGLGSPQDWIQLKQAYGFASEDQALAYKLNPIDNLKPLADAKIPILSVCGDADKTVPFAENTQIVEQRYKALGGEIQVIVKHGCDHHPHSLPDPTPIITFIMAHN